MNLLLLFVLLVTTYKWVIIGAFLTLAWCHSRWPKHPVVRLLWALFNGSVAGLATFALLLIPDAALGAGGWMAGIGALVVLGLATTAKWIDPSQRSSNHF